MLSGRVFLCKRRNLQGVRGAGCDENAFGRLYLFSGWFFVRTQEAKNHLVEQLVAGDIRPKKR